jgi:hypothetical protein
LYLAGCSVDDPGPSSLDSGPPSDSGLVDAAPLDATDSASGSEVRVEVTPRAGIVLREPDGVAIVRVEVSEAPSTDVVLGVQSRDEAQVRAASTPVTIRAGETSVELELVVVDDHIADGPQVVLVDLTSTSSEPRFDGLDLSSVEVVCLDDETPSVAVATRTGTTSEAGGEARFEVVFATRPRADVTIPVLSLDVTEGSSEPTTWSPGAGASIDVVVSGVDDEVADGPRPYEVRLGPTASADPDYDGIDLGSVYLVNEDDDVAGLDVSAPSGPTDEDGTPATFTVRLESRPSHAVGVEIEVDDAAIAYVTPTRFTISPDTWSEEVTVTVRGLSDGRAGVDRTFEVGVSTHSADSSYTNEEVRLDFIRLERTLRAQRVAVGTSHACAIDLGGRVWCWGAQPLLGSLAPASEVSARRAVFLDDTFSARKVVAGQLHTCVLSTDGRVACWGDSRAVGAGEGTYGSALPVVFATEFSDISVARAPYYQFTVAVDAIGTLWGWGEAGFGGYCDRPPPFGICNERNATYGNIMSPTASSYTAVSRVFAATRGTIIVDDEANPRYLGSVPSSGGRTTVAEFSTSPDESRVCHLELDGSLSCNSASVPSGPPPSGRYGALSVGSTMACAIATDGGLHCWSDSTIWEPGGPIPRLGVEPDGAGGFLDRDWVDVSVYGRICAVRSSGELYCWESLDAEPYRIY